MPKVFEKYHPEFGEDIEKKLRNLSETHLTLYVWGKSVIELWETDKQLRPLKEEAQKNKEEKERLDAEFTRLNKEKEEKEKELQALEDERNKSDAIINDLETKKKINSERKNNASLLLTLLKDEGIRWNEQLTTLRQEKKNFLGNIIVSAMFISYLSPFTGNYRLQQAKLLWIILRKCYLTECLTTALTQYRTHQHLMYSFTNPRKM